MTVLQQSFEHSDILTCVYLCACLLTVIGILSSLGHYLGYAASVDSHNSQRITGTMLRSQPSSGTMGSRKPANPRNTEYQYHPKPDPVDNNQTKPGPATVSNMVSGWNSEATRSLEATREALSARNFREVINAATSALDHLTTLAQSARGPEASEAISAQMEKHQTELTRKIAQQNNWDEHLHLPADRHPSSSSVSAWVNPAAAQYCPDAVAIWLRAGPDDAHQVCSRLIYVSPADVVD